jgi:penicillin-binding protein 2
VHKRRIALLLCGVIVAFAAVEMWLFSLQIVRGEEYRSYAERQSVGLIATECARARILTSDGTVLAEDRLAYDVCVVIGRLDPSKERRIRGPLRRLFYVPRRERLRRVTDASFEIRRERTSGGAEQIVVKARSRMDVESDDEDGGPQADVIERRVEFVLPPEVVKSVERLARLTARPADELLREVVDTAIDVASLRVPVFMPVPLVKDVDYDVLSTVDTQPEAFRGFVIRPRFDRIAAGGTLAPHLLGYVSKFNAADVRRAVERYPGWPGRGFFMRQRIGRTGVERKLNDVLCGEFGMECIERDHMNRRIKTLADAPATPGRDVVLTLDSRLQKIVQQALGARVGAAVLIDIKTGYVLAAASAPTYDPDRFREREYFRQLRNNPDHPMVDRAFRGQFPLGSVFKIVTALAALENNSVPTSANCTGSYRFGRRAFRCHRRYGHGSVDLTDAIKYSCNVFFYTMAVKTGYGQLIWMGRHFRFGEKTGINIPGEPAGRMPHSAPGGQLLNLSIGQGELVVSPLQVARMVAAVANDGVMMPPKIVKELRPFDTPGAQVAEPMPDTRKPVSLGISKRSLEAVQLGLYKVVNEHGGTGYRAFAGLNRPFKVCGKSSTAQRRARRNGQVVSDNVGWFAGYAPHDKPRVAFAIAVEHLGPREGGGSTAGPIARNIFDAIPLDLLGLSDGREEGGQ